MSAGTTLFVGNLNYRMNDDDLMTFFKDFGNVVDARVSRERDSNRSRGFGYVTFDTQDEAMHAIEKCNGVDLQGRNIRVEVSEPRQNRNFEGGEKRFGDRRGGGNFRGGSRGRYRDNYRQDNGYYQDRDFDRNHDGNRRGSGGRGRGRYRSNDYDGGRDD